MYEYCIQVKRSNPCDVHGLRRKQIGVHGRVLIWSTHSEEAVPQPSFSEAFRLVLGRHPMFSIVQHSVHETAVLAYTASILCRADLPHLANLGHLQLGHLQTLGADSDSQAAHAQEQIIQPDKHEEGAPQDRNLVHITNTAFSRPATHSWSC